jgi:hypothetical protein
MTKFYEIIKKHKATTGFFTLITNVPGNSVSSTGNFQSVITDLLDFQKQNTLSEEEQVLVGSLINEYRSLAKITLLPTNSNNMW